MDEEFDKETERLEQELDLEKEKELEGEDEDVSNEDGDTSESTETPDNNADDDIVDEDKEEKEIKKTDESEIEEDLSKDKETNDFEPITVKSGDFDIVINSQEDMMAYLQKGVNSQSQKTETKSIEKGIIDQANLTQEDLTLLIDAKNGNKEAIAKLMDIAKVDQFDIEEGMSEQYSPEFKPYMETDIDKVANEIMRDSELTKQYQDITPQLDSDFIEKVQGNAELLKNFSGHLKSGLAMEIIPQAMTHRMKNGGTFFDAYSTIGQEIMSNRGKETPVVKETKPEMSEREKSMRNKIVDQKETSHNSGKPGTAKEIWELTEDEFTEQFGE